MHINNCIEIFTPKCELKTELKKWSKKRSENRITGNRHTVIDMHGQSQARNEFEIQEK